MGILFGFGVNLFVYLVLGGVMSELIKINHWYGLPILVLMILSTVFSGYITAHQSKKRKVIYTLIVSILSYLIIYSAYYGGGLSPSYLDSVYLVQIVPASLLGALINHIIRKKQMV